MGISLKELKKNRLTPAERLVLDAIDGVKPIKTLDGAILWHKNNTFLFETNFKEKKLIIGYDIWSNLNYIFSLTYGEIQYFLTNLLSDYTENGMLTIRLDIQPQTIRDNYIDALNFCFHNFEDVKKQNVSDKIILYFKEKEPLFAQNFEIGELLVSRNRITLPLFNNNKLHFSQIEWVLNTALNKYISPNNLKLNIDI